VTPGEPGPPVFRHLGEREVHEGRIWRVVVARYEAPDGSVFERDGVRSPGAVAVVPLRFDCEGNPAVVLVRQYRPALDRWVLEIPAGMRDVPGEPPEVTAACELAEEAGFHPSHIVPLVLVEPSAGMSDATHHVFVASGLEPVDLAPHGPEEEVLERLEVPLAEALAMVERGEITDAKSVIGLLMTERRLAAGDGLLAPAPPA
jgi:8-oxo-dGTP pyrophosphatase MutT (NUDIX family)